MKSFDFISSRRLWGFVGLTIVVLICQHCRIVELGCCDIEERYFVQLRLLLSLLLLMFTGLTLAAIQQNIASVMTLIFVLVRLDVEGTSVAAAFVRLLSLYL